MAEIDEDCLEPQTELTVIASPLAIWPPNAASPVMRLVGVPVEGELPPPDLLRHAEEAAAELNRTFGDWLWHWIEGHGALDLVVLPGPVSWWWMSPFSEKSPMRSPFIRELYWLTLLRRVLTDSAPKRVRWIGDDPLLADAAAEVARQEGAKFEFQLTAAPRRQGLLWCVGSRLKWTGSQFCLWVLLKLVRTGASPKEVPSVLLYSRFPVLWEEGNGEWSERMYGDWAEHLRSRGEQVGYAAVYSGSLSQLWWRRHEFQDVCVRHGIRFLEPALTAADFLKIHASLVIWWRYASWSRTRRRETVIYDRVNIRRLLWREMDRSSLSGEILFDQCIIAGLQRMLRSGPLPKAVFHPFEYQPMERAVASGVRATGPIPVVGLQTGLFTSNHLGFALTADELRRSAAEVHRAPAPDYLAAYGELPFEAYAKRLGRNRVCLSGAIRYPRLGAKEPFDAKAFCHQHRLPEASRFIFVTTPAGREEALPVLKAAFDFAAENSEVFLLLKFHYHLPLDREVDALAAARDFRQYRVFSGELYSLIRLASVLISGGSSTCIEALALGTMPVVYWPPGDLPFSPVLELPEAVFLWHTERQLRDALRACLSQDGEYEARRKAWPKMMAAQLFRADGKASERLHDFLRQKNVL